MRTFLIGLSATAALLVTACSGGPGEPVAQVESSEAAASTIAAPTASATPGPSDDDLDRFFTALATDESAKIKPILKLAVPGSVAHAYASYLYLRAVAGEGGGFESSPQSIERVGTGWKACPKSKDLGSCVTLDNVQASGNLIANFTANGKSLDQRIIVGNEKRHQVGSIATAQVAISYRSVQSDRTFVVLKIHNGQNKSTVADDTAYQTPKGTQVGTDAMTGPSTFLPGSTAYVIMSFLNAPLGGRVYLNMFTTSGPADGGSVMLSTK